MFPILSKTSGGGSSKIVVMKLRIVPVEAGDRYVKYVTENGKVVHIDFLQGMCEDTFEALAKRDLTPNPIIDIYNRVVAQQEFLFTNVSQLKRIYKINHAIELYIMAYIVQELN